MSALSERPPDLEQFRLVGRRSYELTHTVNIQHCNATCVQIKAVNKHCVSEVIVWQLVKNLSVIDAAL